MKQFLGQGINWNSYFTIPTHPQVSVTHLMRPFVGVISPHLQLVGGFNPSEKNISQIGLFPQVGMKI